MSDREQAVEAFVNVWSDGMLLSDMGPKMTCTEANVLAELLATYGRDDSAEVLIAAHAESDEEGDDVKHLNVKAS